MAWTVRIANNRGKALSEDYLILEFELLANLPSDCVMLRGIDRYGDTLFNGQQLEFFLQEWDKVSPGFVGPKNRLVWDGIRDYAVKCCQEPHTYLRFIGD